MAFCNMCGTPISDNDKVCAVCAARAATASPSYSTVPVPSPSMPTNAAGTSDNTNAMLAYFTFIPAVIFLVTEPYNKSRFVRFHAWQSLMFNAAFIVLWWLLHVPVLGWLFRMARPLVLLAGFAVWLVLVIKANQGQWFKLPTIGDIAEKQAGPV